MRFPTCLAALSLLALASASHAQTVINLSDYLHAPAGQADCDSNPPYMESLSCAAYGFGHDCPGSFSTSFIRFNDTNPFAHGIGMHPPSSGVKSLRFDLDSIRDNTGREPISFAARVGIDVPSGGSNGANFITTLDDVVFNTTAIGSASQPSQQVLFPISGIRFLQLTTQAIGAFNGNHACFADAKVILGPECPHPVLGQQPRSANACPHSTVQFSTIGSYWGSFTYQWRKGGVPISLTENDTAQSATLTIVNVSDSNNGTYDCIVTNSCGDTITNPATLHICPSDFNCDGATDFFDYLDFVAALASGDSAADFNSDGVIDFFDYLDFVAIFSAGC